MDKIEETEVGLVMFFLQNDTNDHLFLKPSTAIPFLHDFLVTSLTQAISGSRPLRSVRNALHPKKLTWSLPQSIETIGNSRAL